MKCKKIISILLAGVMLTSALPATFVAFAQEHRTSQVVADWKFDSSYVKEGTSLENNNLVLQDASGNQNDLVVNTERIEDGKTAADYMQFVDESINQEEGVQSVQMAPKGTSGNDKKVGAFFQTVDSAPIANETFDEGYTFEFVVKIGDDVSAWSSIFGKRGIAKQNGLTGGEPEVSGGLNVSSSGELQWNFYTNNREIQDNPTTWSDAGGIQRNKYHHIVVKNDSNTTTMIIDGIVALRCNTTPDQRGLADLGHGWAVGTAYWSDGETFSESTCGDAIFKGTIQEIRLSKGLLDPSEYLVTEHTPDDDYYMSGNNEPTQFLSSDTNYNFAVIPDPQYVTQYKPAVLDSQNEWLRDHAADYNIAAVLGVGDITQDGTEKEFQNADRSYDLLEEANLPYLLCDGNHDSSIYLKYFGPERYESLPGYQGAGPSGYSKYMITRGGSYDYLFLTIPYEKQYVEQDREWIDSVLSSHPDLPTVIITHFDDNGKNITQDFVKKYDQVFMLLQGHVTYRDAQMITNDYGHPVLNVIVNYQFDPYGGNGILRMMEFDEAKQTITFRSYSPWVEKKQNILNGTIPNDGTLSPDESTMFPFDLLNITNDPSDNAVFSFPFAERFQDMERPEAVDKTLLKDTIDAALEAQQNYLPNLIQSVKERFETALAHAQEVYRDAVGRYNQEDVNQADEALIQAMQYLSFTADLNGLQNAIDHAQEVIASGKYADDEQMQLYRDALQNALDLQKEEYLTDAEIIPAVEALTEAEGNLNPAPALDDAALRREVCLSSAYDLTQYLDGEEKDTFRSALEAASSLLERIDQNDPSVTQQMIDDTVRTLHSSRLNLRLIPNKDALKDLIDQANSLDLEQYTPASVSVLTDALEKATSVYDDPQADAEDLQSAQEELQAALDQLVRKTSDGSTQDGSSSQTGEGQTNLPQTGDSSCALLAFVGVSALAVVLLRKKK